MAAERLENRLTLSAAPLMLGDINQAPASSSPVSLVNFGGSVVFAASDGTTGALGRTVWKSDGTAAGTVFVKDLSSSGYSMAAFGQTTVVGDTLYFVTDQDGLGAELWKSDGTTEGTVLVKDIRPGSSGSEPSNLTPVGDQLYFTAYDDVHGFELWKTDGTTDGTVLVKDTVPGIAGLALSDLTAVGNTLYFYATVPDNIELQDNIQLWKTDGTAAGTFFVMTVHYGSTSDPLRLHLEKTLAAVGDVLYFTADDGVHGTELWRTDGTEAGSVFLVKDVYAGAYGSLPHYLTAVGTTVYFCVIGESGIELYKTDGTADGTVLLKAIVPGPGGYPSNLTAVGSTLYFTADDGVNGFELWRSDGTAAGTILVSDIAPGALDSLPGSLTPLGDALFFSADDGVNGRELWKTDVAASGATLVKNILPGDAGSIPIDLTAVGSAVYFVADDGVNGRELWKTDGTTAGTALVRDLLPGTADSAVENLYSAPQLAVVGDTLLFSADDGVHGRELWKSDGRPEGTALVADIRPGVSVDPRLGWDGGLAIPSSSDPSKFAAVGSTAYFTANDGVNGQELWKSDGTAAGTLLVKDIQAGFWSTFPTGLTAAGGTLYFTADDGVNGWELWKSDGTAAGTQVVEDIQPGGSGSSPWELTAVGSTLYFTADDGANGWELWKSDGTAAGTLLVKDIQSGTGGSVPWNLTAVGGTLYFQADDGVNGIELWKSDGTAAGTLMVKDVRPGIGGAAPSNLTAVGDTLYFTADDGVNGWELWKSDGTAAGTVLVKDILPGGSGSNPRELTAVGSTLYFTADDGANGWELWKSDGSAAGTLLVKDIQSGTGGSVPWNLTAVGGTLYFQADDGVSGIELWKSNGTAAGTMLVYDIRVGGYGSSPESLTAVGNTLYFTADDGVHGRELWMLPPADVDTTAPTAACAAVDSPQTAGVSSIAITFSESVTGLDLADLELRRNGAAVPLTGALITGSGSSYLVSGLVALTGVHGDYSLTVVAANSGIMDAAGNLLNASATTAWTTITSLTGLATEYGIPSVSRSFTVSVGVTANVTATAPVGFEISSGGAFGPSATLVPTSGIVSGTLAVRLAATTKPGTYAGVVALAAPGWAGANIPIAASTVSDEIVFDVAVGQTVTHSVSRFGAVKYFKRGPGTLVLETASSHTGQTTVEAGTLVVANGDALAASAVSVATGGTLTLNAGVMMRTPQLTLAGGALSAAGVTIVVDATTGIGTFTIVSGDVIGAPGMSIGGNGLVTLPTDRRQIVDLSMLAVDQATGGRLDIGKGRINVAVDGIAEANLRAGLIAGRGTGAFNGATGIMTSGGKASPTSANPVIGYRVLANRSAILAWAAYGDANLDGQVTSSDIALVNNGQKFNKGSSTGATWSQGDFNYSGGVTHSDITLIINAQLHDKGSYLPTVGPTGTMESLTFGSTLFSYYVGVAYAPSPISQSPTKKR